MSRTHLRAALLVLVGCNSTPETADPPGSGRASLGELVFRIAKQNVGEANQCSAEYVAALEPHHREFVDQFDYSISSDIQNDVPELLGGTLVPLIEDDRLPNLVRRTADGFGLLVDDSFDPQRKTLGSIANIANTRSLLQPTQLLDIASRVLADPQIIDRVHTLAKVAQEQDSVTYVLDDLLGVVAEGIDQTPASCSGLHVDVQRTLLRADGFVDDPAYALGDPAWMVRPDSNGNPRVLVDSKTGKLAAPFVDGNADGVADVDADGRPIDATGAVIDIPWLHGAGARDDQGRALNNNGGLLYEYYDVKRTALSYSTQLTADLVDGGILHDIAPVASAVLGEPVACSSGPATCQVYPSANHPLADLAHLAYEIMKLDGAPQLINVMQRLLTDDPAKGEQLLVAFADVVTAFRASTLSITDPALLDVAIGLMPMLDKVFAVSNTTGESTPRLLVDLIHDLGPDRAAVPTELGYVLEFQQLTKPSGATTPIGTVAVDYRKTRFYQSGGSWIDNRSAFEHLVELLAYADCGYIGRDNGAFSTSNLAFIAIKALFGEVDDGTVAQVLIDAMSRQSPSTVASLVGFINVLNDLGGVAPVLRLVGCSSADASGTAFHFGSLQTLATSGGLDWILPIARVFQHQGQLRTVVDIFDRLADNLWLDGTFDAPAATSAGVVRKLESPLLAAIDAGAVDRILDAVDLMHGIQVATPSGTSERAGYLVVDVISRAVQTKTVPTRLGPVANSSIALELAKSLKTIVGRLRTAGVDAKFSHGLGIVFDRFKTKTVGTKHAMANPNLRMLAVTWLQVARDASDVSKTQYACYLNSLQSDTTAALTGSNFATLVRVLAQLDVSPNASALQSWLVGMVRGKPGAAAQDVYGPLLSVLAATASSDIAGSDLGNVARWVSGVAAQNTTSARGIVATIDDLIASDRAGALVQILRNLTGPGSGANGESPIVTFGHTFGDVAQIDGAASCKPELAVTVARLETTLNALVAFFHDDVNGVSAVWRLIGAIAPPEQDP